MKTKAEKLKMAAIAWYVASSCFYLSAVIGYFRDGEMDGVCLLIGSAFLCLGGVMLNRSVQAKDEVTQAEDEEKQEERDDGE